MGVVEGGDWGCGEMVFPVVDLSPFMAEGDEEGKKEAVKMIGDACAEYGFLQIVNHGVPDEVIDRHLEYLREFFGYSDEEKRKWSPKTDDLYYAGYVNNSKVAPSKKEEFLINHPSCGYNVYPDKPPGFREELEEIFSYFSRTAMIVESILNDYLGLPPDFLKEYDNNRRTDLMVSFHYFPATDMNDSVGLVSHQDASFITLLLEDDTGGLEVHKDGRWIPVPPVKGGLVVNVGDTLQVVSNGKLKSAEHRVTRKVGKDRYSCGFASMLGLDKWVEPFAQLTTAVGEAPKYRGFTFGEYTMRRLKDLSDAPATPEAARTTKYYEMAA